MSKRFGLIIALLLAIVVVLWIGVSVYTAAFEVEVNPNATQYTPKIKKSFDMEVVEEVTERVQVLPVSPKVIHELKYTESGVETGEELDGENEEEVEYTDDESDGVDSSEGEDAAYYDTDF